LLAVVASLVLAGCAGSPSPRSTESTSPSGVAASVAIELRPVISVVLPGQTEYEGRVDRLGRDVFDQDANGDGSFTQGVEILYVLGAAFVGAGDFASATVTPPPSEYRDMWRVDFTLTPGAGERLSAATTAAGGEIAIVEGERVLVVPTIEEPIASGTGVVPAASQEEAERIAGIMLGS
jgi:hypothetical protein